eukprot:2143720-Rhodomonas_salina.7
MYSEGAGPAGGGDHAKLASTSDAMRTRDDYCYCEDAVLCAGAGHAKKVLSFSGANVSPWHRIARVQADRWLWRPGLVLLQGWRAARRLLRSTATMHEVRTEHRRANAHADAGPTPSGPCVYAVIEASTPVMRPAIPNVRSAYKRSRIGKMLPCSV